MALKGYILKSFKVFIIVTLIYNTILVHGLSPDYMSLDIIVPITMNRYQSMADSENYRAITFTSIIATVIEWVVLIKGSAALGSSDLQFKFKQCVCTTKCSFVVLKTISHYNYNGGNVII